jgi:hypothetical protein
MSNEWGAEFGRGLVEVLKKLFAERDGKIAALEARIKQLETTYSDWQRLPTDTSHERVRSN